MALRDYERSAIQYQAALKRLDEPHLRSCAAQCWKNLGSAMEKLGRHEEQRKAYESALRLDPDLSEAHLALGLWHYHHGNNLSTARQHLDLVAKSPGSALSMRGVNAWRAKILFELGDENSAFDAVNSVVGAEYVAGWEWYWCAKLVSEHGGKAVASARKALVFWRRFIKQYPEDEQAKIEKFNCLWFLHHENEATHTSFDEFESLAKEIVASGFVDKAFIWDRLGHWAQKDDEWSLAESAYRRAAELEPTKYGYCLGVALNHLGRFDEALDVLLPQAKEHEPDALSWFQVAYACENIEQVDVAIAAYERAIELDPDYALAHFNLGGIYWNYDYLLIARTIWSRAIRRFPSHELAHKLQRDLPHLFKLPSKSQR